MAWRITYRTPAWQGPDTDHTVTLDGDWCTAHNLDPDALDEGGPAAAAWYLALSLGLAGEGLIADAELITVEQAEP
jgi:hypothetical protein